MYAPVAAILPEGFVVPPIAYLATAVALAAAVTVVLLALRPTVRRATVLALAPWMVLGAALHVLYVFDAFDPTVAPFFGTPMVYATTYIAAGTVWAGLWMAATSRRAERRIDRRLGLIGTGLAVATIGFILVTGQLTAIRLLWAVVTLVVTGVLTALAWVLVSLRATPWAAKTGSVGVFVVASHALDGVSTAVGIDVYGVGERSPIPRAILSAAESLPIAETVGTGWLFVAVKLVVAIVVVGLFADYVEERPTEALVLLGLIAAVGLGPGVHNLLLLLVAG